MSTHKNNFAVLFLEGTGFEAMSHIAPVCLPQVRYHQFVFKFKWSKICLPLQPCSTYNEENCVANGWGKDKFGSDGRYSLPGSKSLTIPNPDQVRLHLERGCLPCCEPEWVPGERFFWNRCYIKSPIRHLCNLILNTFLLEKKQLRTTRLGRFFELDKSFICAGGVKASQK